MNKEPEKSLYEVGYNEIFWKNFLVGFARGLGGLATHLVLLVIVYLFFLYVVLPKFQPLINMMEKTQQNMEKLQNPTSIFEDIFNQEQSKQLDLDTPTKTR
jgi:hypothetical protein